MGTERTRQITNQEQLPYLFAEMAKQAPYARDAEYAVLDPKDSKALDQVPFDDSVYQDGNPGGSEQPGALGNDRVFLANNTDENKGINYLDAGKGVSYEGTSRAYLLIAADEQKDIYDGMNMPFGSGENYPSTVILPYDTYTHDVVAGQNALGLQESITELNKRSMRDQHYGGKIVVPLRRGIMQFEHDMFGGYPSGVKRGATTQNTKVVA